MTVPAASVCFHRALLSLIPAMTLTLVALRSAVGALILGLVIGLAIVAFGVGTYWLWRGSQQLAAQSSQPRR
jgi:multisubunit Na+/H+ antiporter MnhB subunit